MADLTDLLLSDDRVAELCARPPRARRKRMKTFESGFMVVPAAWREALAKCQCRDTRNVAWGLLEKAARASYRGEELYFTALDATLSGVPRRARRVALRELQDLGLAELRHECGAPFAVTLLRMG